LKWLRQRVTGSGAPGHIDSRRPGALNRHALSKGGGGMASSVALEFVDAIDAHDVARIVALCSPDHEFVDAHGTRIGDATVRAAWTG
jgi:hypothetical protein